MDVKDSDAARLWCKAMDVVLKKGFEYKDNEGRICKEILNLNVTLENPGSSGVESPITMINESRKWVYPSKEELVNIIFKEVQAPVYDYTYGGRIFNFAEEFDQLNDYIIPLLKSACISFRSNIPGSSNSKAGRP